ncbi:MAG: hypothetical protein AMXMBFR4_16070 [Candidatus Hydrogenedentota bacterium]
MRQRSGVWIMMAAAALLAVSPAWATSGRTSGTSGYIHYYNGTPSSAKTVHGGVVVHTGPVVHNHGPYCCWVPPHYTTIARQVFVPGHWETKYIPPVYDRIYFNGRMHVKLVSEARYERVWIPAYWTTVYDQVYVPGCWSCGFP